MLAAMHGVLQKIEQQEGRHKAYPLVSNWPRWQSHAKRGLELRPEDPRRREGKGGDDDIEEPDPNIAEAPAQCRKFAATARPAQFSQRDDNQAAENDGQACQGSLP